MVHYYGFIIITLMYILVLLDWERLSKFKCWLHKLL